MPARTALPSSCGSCSNHCPHEWVYSGVFRQLPGTEGGGKWGYKGRRPLKASRDPKEGWRQLLGVWRRAGLAQGLQP